LPSRIMRRIVQEVGRARLSRSYSRSQIAVLIIGDSISEGYTPFVQVEGVHVEHCQGNAGHTDYTLEHLEEYLSQRPRWDIIIWNNGLHDLRRYHVEPVVPLPKYRQNLETIAGRLQATNARVVFATTTHVPEGAANRSESDVVAYNQVAQETLGACAVEFLDLHSASISLARPTPGNVHFTCDGYASLGAYVGRKIRQMLK